MKITNFIYKIKYILITLVVPLLSRGLALFRQFSNMNLFDQGLRSAY